MPEVRPPHGENRARRSADIFSDGDQRRARFSPCGGKVESVVTAPAIKFKGSGWYVTDYAGKSPDGGSKESKPASDSKESSGKESSGKDSAAKDGSGTEAAGKDSAGKETASKETSPKEKKSTKKK